MHPILTLLDVHIRKATGIDSARCVGINEEKVLDRHKEELLLFLLEGDSLFVSCEMAKNNREGS